MTMLEKIAGSLRALRLSCRGRGTGAEEWWIVDDRDHSIGDRNVIAGPFRKYIDAKHAAAMINARAAVEAMLDPSDRMMLAAYETPEELGNADNTRELARMMYSRKYRAMLNAILTEKAQAAVAPPTPPS